MAKSMVERYEQLLLQDPTSAVFVELAKALLEKGEHPRAIEVCQQGLGHHPQSVIGRVLWGKALLHQGRPAEAMEQFDQAIAIDKENAHAYNLIGEVLVQRGLFRSALPILRKAAALQPNDGRVKLWLDQTQQALSGGPPPVVAELPGLTANELAPKPVEEEAPAPPPEPKTPVVEPPRDEEEEQTAVRTLSAPTESEQPSAPWDGDDATRQFTTIRVDEFPSEPIPGQASAPAEAASVGQASAPRQAQAFSQGTPSGGRAKVYMFPPRKGVAAAPLPPPASEEELADTPPPFARGEGDELEDTPTPRSAARAARAEREQSSGGLLPDVDGPDAGAEGEGQQPSDEEETQPGDEVASASPSSSSGEGLLGDLPPPDEGELPAVPAAARVSETARTSAPRSRAASRGAAAAQRALLDEIPEATEPEPAAVARASAAAQVDAAAAAAAYEKELREKISRSAANPSFLQRYGLRIAVGAVLVVVLGVGLGVYLFRRAAQGGQTLAEVLERTDRFISLDTRNSFGDALTLLERAQEMDDGNSRVWALKAYTHALLYADHGGKIEDRQQALVALEHAGVRTEHPGLSLATDVLVADDKARATVRRALLEGKGEGSTEVHTLAGSVLLEDKKQEKALEHFKRALEQSARNVRALVALGQYYQDFDDYSNAVKVYGSAHEISPGHPLARIGLAESRLALGQELSEALTDIQALGGDPTLPEALRARQQLIHGRLLAEQGKHDESLKLLSSGTKGPLAFDFLIAQGDASRAAGRLPESQQAFEAALKLQPKSEQAREGLGRALLDRDRVKEALDKLSGSEGRRVALVRAAAYARQEDWKRVKAELEKTKVNNRYVPEAVGYLAVADTADGSNVEQAREILEKAVARQPRTDLRLALGRVYWRQSVLDKAQAQFEEAMKDSKSYEAACALGRLLLSRGLPDLALKPLTQAVERNGFHGEARDALGRALLAVGRTEEGFKQFEAWKNDNPDSSQALKGYALGLLRSGQRQQAAEVIRSAKLDAKDSEGYRLRAVILYANGDPRSGIAALQRAAQLNPGDPETFCEIAFTFLRQDKLDDADGAFEKARENGPDTPCGLVGEHYVSLDGGKTTAEALRTIMGRASTVWDKAFAQATIARVLLNSSNVKGARTAAEEAVKLDPFNAPAQLALGLVALRQRQEEVALAALGKAVELDPANGMAHLAMADALVRKQEELPRAIQEYEAFLKYAGSSEEAKRVKKALPNLKRRVK